MVKKRKLRWFGHISGFPGSAKTILQGTVKGKRRDRQKKDGKTLLKSRQEWTLPAQLGQPKTGQDTPLPIDLHMDFGEKSRVMNVLQRAYAGNVVEKRVAGAAIREFEGILDELYSRPPKWEMVTMHRDEVENMREIIKYQDKKLREVTERVNSMSHGDIPKYPLATVEDHSDMKNRMDLATKFNAIYDREWRMAYSELYDSLRWKDAECIYSLMRVVRNASDLCYNLATDQLENLLVNMENTVVNPLNGSNTRFKQLYQGPNIKYTEGMTVAEKYALEYRRKRAEASVPAVIELFMETKLRMIIDPADLKREMKKYIEKVVEVIWLMTAQNPAMRIYWQQQTERVLTEFFNYYDRKGDFVNQTVWPAVFVHSTGKLLSKGYILAM